MDSGESSIPYCKLVLGREKNRSKTIPGTVNPKWREGFDMSWSEQDVDCSGVLELTVWDKDIGSKEDFMGRCENVVVITVIGRN
jgi:Ca2+-dependent lipid-binding protein